MLKATLTGVIIYKNTKEILIAVAREIKELGSEFMLNSYKKGHNDYLDILSYPKRYVLSGRTGLYLIAQELLIKKISSVALPEYCCGSMVMPFVEAGIKVNFYGKEGIPKEGAVLVMDYFGFLSIQTVTFAQRCKEKGLVIIVDGTQTAFCKAKTYEFADYIVVSYRKWLDCLCAAVYSREGFQVEPYEKSANVFCDTWREAARKKRLYIDESIGNKMEFLELYAKANNMLSKDYMGYKARENEIEILENIDTVYLRTKRRDNAQILINGIKNEVELMFNTINKEDCPLHVPIIVPSKKRARLKEMLIQQQIYCPCHWPVDKQYPYHETSFHNEELSLICDQRYSIADMEAELRNLLSILKED